MSRLEEAHAAALREAATASHKYDIERKELEEAVSQSMEIIRTFVERHARILSSLCINTPDEEDCHSPGSDPSELFTVVVEDGATPMSPCTGKMLAGLKRDSLHHNKSRKDHTNAAEGENVLIPNSLGGCEQLELAVVHAVSVVKQAVIRLQNRAELAELQHDSSWSKGDDKCYSDGFVNELHPTDYQADVLRSGPDIEHVSVEIHQMNPDDCLADSQNTKANECVGGAWKLHAAAIKENEVEVALLFVLCCKCRSASNISCRVKHLF